MANGAGLLDRLTFTDSKSANFRDPSEPPEADVVASLTATADKGTDPVYGGTLDPDPLPPPRKKTATRKPAARVNTAQIRKRLVDELRMLLTFSATMWELRCAECGSTLADRVDAGANALADVVMRSEWLVARVESTSLISDVFKLLYAFWPVAQTAMRHNIDHIHHHDDPTTPIGAPQWNDYAPFRPAA